MTGDAGGDLVERALAAARRRGPGGPLAVLEGIAGRLSVVEDPEAGTARIRAAGPGRYRVEISPAFLARHVRCDEDALHLLLHELVHKVHGDFRREVGGDLPSRVFLKFALDVYVDAHLARLAFPAGPPYLARLYPPGRFPGVLLLPPAELARRSAGLSEAWGEFALPHDALARALEADPVARARFACLVGRALREAGCTNPTRVAALYRRDWLDQVPFNAFFEDFGRALAAKCPGLEALAADLVLLGDHDPGAGDEGLAGLCGGLAAGRAEGVTEDRVHAADPVTCREFLEAIRRAVCPGGLPHGALGSRTDPAVVGQPGRRELAFLAAGVTPAFWPAPLPGPAESEEQVHLYLDVSGSTGCWQPLLYGLALHLEEALARPVWLFSNAVLPVSIAELAEGVRRGTGGTNFDCVWRHALERRLLRVLLVTDGDAALSEPLWREGEERGLEAYVVFTGRMGRAGWPGAGARGPPGPRGGWPGWQCPGSDPAGSAAPCDPGGRPP